MNKFIKFLKLFFITAIVLLAAYILLFEKFEPGYLDVEKVVVDIESWNSDDDIHTIESRFILLENYKTRLNLLVDKDGIIYRRAFKDRKKYIIPKGVDSFYVATDMASGIIRNFDSLSVKSDSLLNIKRIKNYSDWLLDNAVWKDSCSTWPYPFGFSKYDLEPGWYGAWAAGQILSAVSRSVQLNQDSSLIILAEGILSSFEKPVSEGGLLAKENKYSYWYEEYPTDPFSHVLNGHINALLGLYDYWRISGSVRAKKLFNNGITTVLNNMNNFDTGYWSKYDMMYPYLADYYYHKTVHIPQMRILYQITNNDEFKDIADKWETYFNEPYLSIFKLRVLFDALHRRFTYKSFFTLGKY